MDISIIIACSRIDKIKLILEGFSKQETEYCYEVIVVGCEINISNENYNYLIKVINCNQTHPNIKRNIGIDHATSKIIGFMDDDAIPERNWVDTAV